MLSAVILATALWVCPGEVYTNVPQPGCQPFHQSPREGFNVLQEPADGAPQAGRVGGPPPTVVIEQPPVGPPRSRASEQECARYREWLDLSRKTENMGAHTLTVQEFERWQVLREQYSNMDPALCEDQ